MTGLLPFSGGSYGFSRVTLGPYIGFIVGCLDAFRCLVYVIRRTRFIGLIISETFQTENDYSPIYWLVFFVPSIFIDSLGRRKFWGFITVLAVVTIIFTLLYFLAAAPGMNFDRYVLQSDLPEFSNTYKDFVLSMTALARMYQGITTIPLACEEANNAQKDVPRAMIATLWTTFFLGAMLIFACCSHAPGVLGLPTTSFPLSFGFADGFNLPVHFGPIFSFAAVYATCYGYAYSYGRILCAMARSGLLPQWISTVRGERDTPIVGIILGNLLMYIVMLALHFTDNSDNSVSAAALIATVFVYWSVFMSFGILRIRFSNLKRSYVNPFGIASAVIGAIIFAVYLTDLAYVDYNYAAVIIFGGFVAICTTYYIAYAAKAQCYSDEEQSIMLVLYVMKANKMKRIKKKKPNFVPYQYGAPHKLSKYADRNHSNSIDNTNTDTQQTSLRHQVVHSSISSLRKIVPINFNSSNHSESKAAVTREDGKTTSLHETHHLFSSREIIGSDDNQEEQYNQEEEPMSPGEEMTLTTEQQPPLPQQLQQQQSRA